MYRLSTIWNQSKTGIFSLKLTNQTYRKNLLWLVLWMLSLLGTASGNTSYEELTFLSTENDLYISGETIFISAFCLNKQSLAPSSVSSIGYVVLLNEAKEVVHETKLPLSDGRGSGEVFVKSNFPTGHYYLLIYTSLMRNQPSSDIYYKELTIVNPFVSYENPRSATTPELVRKAEHTKGEIKIEMKNAVLQTRSQSSIQIVSPKSLSLLVTIQKKDSLSDSRENTKKLFEKYLEQRAKTRQPSLAEPSYQYIPDTKGELITGQISSFPDSISFPIKLYLSFPGNRFYFFSTQVQSAGDTFHFNLPKQSLGDRFFLESPECRSCTFEVFSKFPEDYQFVKTWPLQLREDQLRIINERSILSQVENAYYSSKQSVQENIYRPFYGRPDHKYIIDDYTSFNNMEDVFREITSSISLRKTEAEHQIRIYGQNGRSLDNPLLLVDGMLVYNTLDIVNMDPKVIRSIEVVSRVYHQGANRHNGIISIQTTRSIDPWQTSKAAISHIGVEQNKFQEHLLRNYERIPSFSRVLLWQPAVQMNAGIPKEIKFNTGDITGSYEISIFGIDQNGVPIHVSADFSVE